MHTICRNICCSSVIISDVVLTDSVTSAVTNVNVYDYFRQMDSVPVVKCCLRCTYFVVWVEANHDPIKFCSVLVGNIPGVVESDIENKKG